MKKRVAILSFFKGHSKRGVETWVDGLATNLVSDFSVRVYQSVEEKNRKYQIYTPQLKLDWGMHENKNSLFRKFYLDYWSMRVLIFNFKIIFNLLKFSPDIVLATDGGWEVRLMRMFTWVAGGKLVIVGQAGIGFDEYNNIYSFPDCFIALSENAKHWAKKNNPFIKVVKIPNAVDIDKFTLVKRKSKKLKNILSVGALEKGKRMDKIIQAVSKLKNYRLTIIGEGPEKSNLIKLAKKLDVKNFEIKQVQHEDICKEFQKADVFISASESYYAFEIVIIEAMATNLPVVVNTDQIRAEIVGKSGILSDPNDVDVFASNIKKALEINWRDKPRKQAEKFSWEVVSKKYISLFNKL